MKTINLLIITASIAVTAGCSDKQDATLPPTTEAPAQLTFAQKEPSELTMVDYDALEEEAFNGDYQAQRNLAYWLSGGLGTPPLNPILGCAWRIVILNSGSLSVDQTDASNKTRYCDDKLTSEEFAADEAQAETILSTLKEE